MSLYQGLGFPILFVVGGVVTTGGFAKCTMGRQYLYLLILGTAVLLLSACEQSRAPVNQGTPSSTEVITPVIKGTLQSEPIPLPTLVGIPVVEAAVRRAEVVLIGATSKPGLLVEVPSQPERPGALYRDWEVEVERYFTAPLAQTKIMVRTREEIIPPLGKGPSRPSKELGLAENTRYLLFLGRRQGFVLEPDQFTILSLMVGAFPITDGKVFYGPMVGPPEEEPLEDALTRVQRALQQ